MTIPLRLLILEDRPSDVELMLAELRASGFEPDWKQVASEADYLSALDPALDLILADYHLPQFDGVRALKLMQERGLDIPLILVSGTVGEETAAEAMKEGAADYMLKDRMARLGQAVSYALEQRRLRDETQRAQKSLHESETRFRSLIENSSEGISIITADGKLLYESPTINPTLGYRTGEFLGQSLFQLIHPDDLERVQNQFVRLVQDPSLHPRDQFRLRHHDGTWRWVEAGGTNLLSEPGVGGIVVNYHDITERKRIEAERQALLQITQGVAATESLEELLELIRLALGNVIYAENFFVVFHNRSTGLFEEVYAVDKYDAPMPPSRLERSITSYVFRTGAPLLLTEAMFEELRARGEVELVGTKQGIWLGAPLKTPSETIGVIAVQNYEDADCYSERDREFLGSVAVQVSLAIERKRAEKALARRADEFAALYETASEIAGQNDLSKLLQTISQRAAKLLKVPGGGIYLFDADRNDLQVVASTNESIPLGARLEMGEGMAGRVAQTRQPLIVDDYRSWEHRARQYDGIPFTSIVEVPMLYSGNLIGVLVAYNIGNTTRRLTEADARLLSLLASAAAGAVNNARDLAERKQVEEALRQNEAALRKAQEIAKLGTWSYDLMKGRLSWSDAMYRIYGVSPETFTPNVENFVKLIHPDDQPAMQAWITACTAGEEPDELEFRIILPDGTVRFISGRGELIYDVDGKPSHLAGTAQEVTDRKQTEQALLRRADEFAALYETAQDLAGVQSLPNLLQAIVERATALFNSTYGTLSLYDAAQEEIELVAVRGLSVLPGTRLKLGEGLAGYVAQTRQPMILDDYSNWQDRLPVFNGVPLGSTIEIPMLYGGELTGTIGVGEVGTHRKYTEADMHLLSLFAGQAAGAIHNARLYQNVQHRLTELELIYENGLAINQLLQPKEIAQKIIGLLEQKMDWHHTAIRLYHPQDETLELLEFSHSTSKSRQERLEAEARFSNLITALGEGLSGWAVQNSQVVRSGNVSNDPRYVEVYPGMKSGLYVPMKSGGRVIGVISIESVRPNAFSAEHERLVSTLANQAASALVNAGLLEEAQRRLRRTLALREIDQAIAGSMHLKLVLEIVLKHILSELGVDAALILLHDADEQVLKYELGKGFRTHALQFTRLRLGDGYAGQAALGRQTIHIPNLQTRTTDFLRSPYFSQEGFVCYFGVPLIAKGEVKGVLEIFHRSRIDPNSEWLGFMETLAGQIAIAIDNATLYKHLQRSNIELALAYDATIEGWSRALDLRDKETEGHTLRVTDMTIKLARLMGTSENDLIQIRRGALLHDIGKMGVPDSILLKPDKLSAEEWILMKKHPNFAYEMLQPIRYLGSAVDIPYCHHEKWDGSGYPRGLKGEQIPLAARIFAVVDIWDALLSDRPYRPAWTETQAMEYIRELSGSHLDPQVVAAFFDTGIYKDPRG